MDVKDLEHLTSSVPLFANLEKAQRDTITSQLLTEMSRQLCRTNRQINILSLMSVYGRVAEVILTLSKENGKRFGKMIVIDNHPDVSGACRDGGDKAVNCFQSTITTAEKVVYNN